MKKITLKFTLVLLCLATAINAANGQVCNIIRNSSFAQTPAVVGSMVDSSGTNVPSWRAPYWGTPDVYTGFKIFMWDQLGNPPTSPALANEYIFQNLCQAIPSSTTQSYTLFLEAATTARGLGNGRLEVLLSDGVNNFIVASIAALGLTPITYQFNNINSVLPMGTYNKLIIRPVANPGATMDIIVDNIMLGLPSAQTRYVMDVNCCQGSQLITYPGQVDGFDGVQWTDFSTGMVVGNTPTITVTPTKSGSTYLVRKSRPLCSGGSCIVIDTVVLRCCGGDNDWEFTNPNGLTSFDPIHRTGEVNIGNLAVVPGAPDIAKVEIKNNDNAKWNCFMLNGAGSGKMLRIKGGFYQGQHSIFQVEANGATDYTEDNVRLMVRADGRVGINTTTPRGTLDVNGSTWNTAGVWQTSDQRFKENIEVIGNAAEILKNIKGYRYDFRTKEFPDRNFNEGRQIGFIAQELRQVVPEAVVEGDDGYLAVNYDMMVPVLVEAYKELKTEMEALKQTVMTKLNTTEIVTANTLQMECYPNPFSNTIEVKFNLATASAVSVKIINVEGKVVSNVAESRYEAGKQKLSINTQSLPSGSYVLLVSTEDGVYSHKIVCNK